MTELDDRPTCPRCGEAPTEVTIPVDEEGLSWQDVCNPCAVKIGKAYATEQNRLLKAGEIEEVLPLIVVPLEAPPEPEE